MMNMKKLTSKKFLHKNYHVQERNVLPTMTIKNKQNNFLPSIGWCVAIMLAAILLVSSFCIYYVTAENRFIIIGCNAILTIISAVIIVAYVRRSHNAVLKIAENGVYDSILAGVDVMDAGFFLVVDKDGKIIHTDAQYEKYFSSPASKNIMSIADFLNIGKMKEEDRKAIEDSLLSKGDAYGNFVVQTTNGEALNVILAIKFIDIGETLKYSSSLQKAYMLRKYFHGVKECFLIKAIAHERIEDKQKVFFDTCPVGVYAATEEGELLYCNNIFKTMLGYDPTAVLPAYNINQWLTEAEQDSDASECSILQICKEEGEVIEMLSYPLKNTQGSRNNYNIVLPFSLGKDKVYVSERNANATMADFLEESPVAQVVLTENGEIEQSNTAFRMLVGGQDSDLEMKRFLSLVDEKNIREVDACIQQALKSNNSAWGEIKPIDIQLLGEKGGMALLYMRRLSGECGKDVRLIAHLIDTTEQKNLELRFVHSQKMQAVGQLAGGIAHDFNNLLTAMIGFCDLLLLRHPAGDQSFADLMQIKQNTNRAANLVRQLLAFSRKQTLQPEILDITTVLAELSSLVRRLIGENIDLKVQHGQDLWLVKVDQGQLDQVMINLAVNARDAMNGVGSLTIRSSNVVIQNKQSLDRHLISPAEDEIIVPGNYVLIEVIDTGTGIPKELIGKIFEPFFSTKEVGSGTGLGLSTVYGIVKQTGGYIYVSSKQGEGTTFSIFLKGYDKSEVKENNNEIADKAPLVDLTGSGTILLVEDETPVRIFSSHALTNKGYTVLEAASGDMALQIIDEKGLDINVIITDVIMPGMNGPAMIEEISKKYPHIKVIFMSGYAEDVFIKTYGAERKFNFLPKPFTLKQLAGKVKEVMSS